MAKFLYNPTDQDLPVPQLGDITYRDRSGRVISGVFPLPARTGMPISAEMASRFEGNSVLEVRDFDVAAARLALVPKEMTAVKLSLDDARRAEGSDEDEETPA